MESRSLAELLEIAWQRWEPNLRAFARRLTGDRDDADDAVQDGILRTLNAKNPALQDERAAYRFLYVAIRSSVIDRVRRRRSRSRMHKLLRAHSPRYASNALEDQLVVDLRLAKRARRRALEIAVANLEPALREALELYYLTEPHLKFHEIAHIQGTSASTAYMRVQRALAELRDSLPKKMEDENE